MQLLSGISFDSSRNLRADRRDTCGGQQACPPIRRIPLGRRGATRIGPCVGAEKVPDVKSQAQRDLSLCCFRLRNNGWYSANTSTMPTRRGFSVGHPPPSANEKSPWRVRPAQAWKWRRFTGGRWQQEYTRSGGQRVDGRTAPMYASMPEFSPMFRCDGGTATP